ncbi:MAG: prephenate dehydrogenase [Anaerolineae bacterium]
MAEVEPGPCIAIVGLGLMGGSLALALRAAGDAVGPIIGVDRDPAVVQAALARGAIAEGYAGLGAFLAGADIIVLAAPVRTIIDLVPVVGALAHPGALVLDLGSAKGEVIRAMDQLPPDLHAVGGHPMCGKETSGLAAADAQLYRDKLFILTPTARSDKAGLARAAWLAQTVGARSEVMDAARHDQLVAAVSHVPFLVAANLVHTASGWAEHDPAVWRTAASGFRDTTRLAASDTTMMLDILLTNRDCIRACLQDYVHSLSELATLVANGDAAVLAPWLAAAAESRRMWERGMNHG